MKSRSHSSHGPLRRFVGYTRPYWRHLAASLIATIIYVSLSAALIWLIGPLVGALFGTESALPSAALPAGVDAGGLGGWLESIKSSFWEFMDRVLLHSDRATTLARVCVAIALLSLAKNALRYLQMILVAIVQQRVVRRLREELFAHYHDLSMAYYAKTRGGQIMSRVVHDVMILNQMLDMGFNRLLRDPLMVLILFGSLFVISWKLTLLALVVLPLSMGVMAVAGRYTRRYSVRSQERMADLSSVLEETVGGVRIVKAFGAEAHEQKRFGFANNAYYRAMVKMLRVRHFSAPINEFFGTIAAVVILWFGGRAVLSGTDIAPGEFMTYIFLVFSIIQPIKSLTSVHIRIAEGRAAAVRVFEVLDTPIDVQDRPGARPLQGFHEGIRFRDVGFRYETGDWVLRDIDLTIPRGSSVALVGPSGGGKSTLCDLLARFYDPIEGAVTIDGADIREYQTATLRAHLGVVTQEVILFNETVAHNIAYGDPAPDPERLRRAADAAYALEFIEALPDGFDSVIGPRGMTLSGGQCQRLAVARAIYRDPPILIFDEATSALDTESEIVVQRAIDNLLRDRTALIVAHRLSTVRNADLIVVVDGGRIVDSGSHDELMERGGLYHRLHEMQFADHALPAGKPDEAPRPVM